MNEQQVQQFRDGVEGQNNELPPAGWIVNIKTPKACMEVILDYDVCDRIEELCARSELSISDFLVAAVYSKLAKHTCDPTAPAAGAIAGHLDNQQKLSRKQLAEDIVRSIAEKERIAEEYIHKPMREYFDRADAWREKHVANGGSIFDPYPNS